MVIINLSQKEAATLVKQLVEQLAVVAIGIDHFYTTGLDKERPEQAHKLLFNVTK